MSEFEQEKGKISNNEKFKHKYKLFYKMYLAPSFSPEFYDKYFKYLEENYENKNLKFEDVLNHISNLSNRVETSFSSKLLATINPDRAIWNKKIRNKLNIKDAKTIDDAIILYKELEDKVKNYEYTNEYIEIFDETFKNILPIEKITPIKKIDFVLWSLD